VEVQLGEVDASHSFRVFDYWARNRMRFKDKTHVAVLMVESATGRYRSALDALAEYLPLVVIELRTWRGEAEVILVPETLTLPRRLVIRCNAARWPGAPYWFHFSLRELEPSAEFFHRWLAFFGQPNSKPYAQFPQASQLVLTTLHPTGRVKLIRKARGINAHPISSHPVNIFQCLI
jgi:hypothetical protein